MKRFFNSPLIILLIIMLAMNILDGEFSDPIHWFVNTLLMLPAILIGLCFHEYAHGLASYILGDPTPKIQGRLTINPFKHFDAFGFLALMFAGFGWGIPVEIDPRYYKRPRRDELIVSLAGVTMNLLIAIIFSLVLKIIFIVDSSFGSTIVTSNILEILINIIYINIVLMVFNLLPIPPLDGFGVVTQLFNLREKNWYPVVYGNGFAILFVLIIIGALDNVIGYPITYIFNLLTKYIILY